MKRFIAVDGESLTEGGDHKYVLLASSQGTYIYDANGLPTSDCLDFLLNLPPKAIHVAFGWNYDVNMILRDVTLPDLVRLWKSGELNWKGYHLEWIPSKWFVVKRGKRTRKICEMFGFFQSSFVNALRKWDIEPMDDIEAMKQERGAFDAAMKERIINYCISECRQAVELMDELEIALDAVNLKLRSWVGAGSIASALMQREGIKNYLEPDSTYGEVVYDAIRRSYFGGRSELFLQGSFDTLWDYDIVSAYPSYAQYLPSMAGGTWTETNDYCNHPYSLWLCHWELDPNVVISPFPVRPSDTKTDIYYPYSGRGWYHGVEVEAARRIYGDAIVVERGVTFEPGNSRLRPFEFIPELFAYRRELKDEGHGGEKVIKLGLNSLYGKLAQGVGYGGKPPPFQSYYWAGLITASTRARVMELAALAPDDLVMVATDGIFFRKPIDVELSNQLGGLELTVMSDVFVAQPGVYSATVDGESFGRSRGFFSREIDFDQLRLGFQTAGPHYTGKYESTRFVGIGSALLTKSLSDWRTWKTNERKLSLYPSRKFIDDDAGSTNPVRHAPPYCDPTLISARYRARVAQSPITDDEIAAYLGYTQGIEQPLRDY